MIFLMKLYVPLLRGEISSKGYVAGFYLSEVDGARTLRRFMDERFLPADDPVLEGVLNWTIDRDATDIRKLLEWLPQARSSKERKALLVRVNELLSELEIALDGLETLH